MSLPTNTDSTQSGSLAKPRSAHIIVFGNEKGGSGKSTSAMHVAIALLRAGYRVGTIDLDARQGTFTRYFRNRFSFITGHKTPLPSPNHMPIERNATEENEARRMEEEAFLEMALLELSRDHDFIIIDTPGTDCYLSRIAHAKADTLVTPMNDSLVDLDVLAEIDPDTLRVKGPSVYAQMVLDTQSTRITVGERPARWIVMRNRLSHIDATNKRQMSDLLVEIGDKFGCAVAPGFGERVIFKELFLKGLTLMDLEEDPETTLSMSALSARQEVRDLIAVIDPARCLADP